MDLGWVKRIIVVARRRGPDGLNGTRVAEFGPGQNKTHLFIRGFWLIIDWIIYSEALQGCQYLENLPMHTEHWTNLVHTRSLYYIRPERVQESAGMYQRARVKPPPPTERG